MDNVLSSILASIDWTEVLLTVVTVVFIPLLGKLIESANTWVKTKINSIKDHDTRETAEKYFEIAQCLTVDIVDYLNTTLVNDMKIASSDGKLTQEEASEIMTKAKSYILSNLGEAGQTALSTVYNDLDSLLEAWITNAVEKSKLSDTGSGIDSSTAKFLATDNQVNPNCDDDEKFIKDEEEAMKS